MLFRDPFRLRWTLSESSSADGEDTLKTKKALKSMGYYRTPSFGLTDFPDDEMFAGIKRFQRDKALSVDGIMRPGGETERAMGASLANKGLMPTQPQPTVTLQDTMEALLKRIRDKAKDDEIVSSNQRLVKAALKVSDHTDLAKLHADAVRDAGDGALAELVEFQKQLGVASKDAHKSWTAAFARELPEAAKKMTAAIQLMAKAAQRAQATQMKQPAKTAESSSPQSPEGGNGDANLKGGAKTDTLGTSLADKLKPAPRKPAVAVRTVDVQGGTSSGKIALPPIPKNKTDWFKGKEQEWIGFHGAVSALPDVSATEHAVYMHIFGQEGGHQRAEGGTASAGLLQETADLYLGKDELKHIQKETPSETLSAEIKALIYRKYFDDQFPNIGGHKVLSEIGDELGAKALAEGMFRVGPRVATEIIQNVMADIDPSFSEDDKVFGSRTYTKYKTMLLSPRHRERLLNAIADGYIEAFPKERARFDLLRPQRPR